jgi:hypothetical protein
MICRSMLTMWAWRMPRRLITSVMAMRAGSSPGSAEAA